MRSPETETAVAPSWLLELAARSGTGERSLDAGKAIVELDTPQALARAAKYLREGAEEAIEGNGGDSATIRVANRVLDLGIAPASVVELMLDYWNGKKAIPPWEPEDLRAKVFSAARSRLRPIGIANPEAEFEAVEIADAEIPTPAKKPPRLRFELWRDVHADVERAWLVDDILLLNTIGVTYGDSNSGKSFVALDMAFAVATGRPWNGRKVQQGGVVYIAAEGAEGFRTRVEAFRQHYGAADIPFALVPCSVDLQSAHADTPALIRLVKEAEAAMAQRCVLIVVDTLSRAMGGGDENSTADMGNFVRNCDRLREATGATVHVIHHTGKDKSKGLRGAYVLTANVDTTNLIEPGIFVPGKQRDAGKAAPFHFRLAPVVVGCRGDGKAVTSCVVEWAAAAEFVPELSPAQGAALDAIEAIIEEKRATRSNPLAKFNEWFARFVVVRGRRGTEAADKRAFTRIVDALVQARFVEKIQRGQYVRTDLVRGAE